MRLTVVRDGREQTIDLPVGELSERVVSASASPRRTEPLGLSVADTTPDVARRIGLPPTLQGVVVAEVLPGALAAEAGLRPGDVIQEVNRRPVRSARDFAQAVQGAGDRDLVLLVNRGGHTAYVVIERTA